MIYSIEPTETTPKVDFNSETGNFLLTGKSFWENSDALYRPILDWLESEYLPNPADHTKLTVQLDYFNTATAKALLDIFKRLERIQKSGMQVDIIWRYNELDEDLEESGVDYQELTSLNIILEPYKGSE